MSSPKRLARIAGVVAAFVAACRAAVLSDRTVEFYLEGLNSYRASRASTSATWRWPTSTWASPGLGWPTSSNGVASRHDFR